jgi:hypothetical protein
VGASTSTVCFRDSFTFSPLVWKWGRRVICLPHLLVCVCLENGKIYGKKSLGIKCVYFFLVRIVFPSLLSPTKVECECGDVLQTEEHIFRDCKLYEDQRATMMDILSKNCKKEYPKSVTELLRLEEKRFVQGVCYFMNKIPKFIF